MWCCISVLLLPTVVTTNGATPTSAQVAASPSGAGHVLNSKPPLPSSAALKLDNPGHFSLGRSSQNSDSIARFLTRRQSTAELFSPSAWQHTSPSVRPSRAARTVTSDGSRPRRLAGDPVLQLLRRLQRRHQLPTGLSSNYSLVLVTDPAAAGPLPWPDRPPPVPVSATLLGLPRPAGAAPRAPTRRSLWGLVDQVGRWLRRASNGTAPLSRRAGDWSPSRPPTHTADIIPTHRYHWQPPVGYAANTSSKTERMIPRIIENTNTANHSDFHGDINDTKDSRPNVSAHVDPQEAGPTPAGDRGVAGSDPAGRNDINQISPLATHNMDEAPVTRYNVQNLVPANGYVPNSPIDGGGSGGHDALYLANAVELGLLPSAGRSSLLRSAAETHQQESVREPSHGTLETAPPDMQSAGQTLLSDPTGGVATPVVRHADIAASPPPAGEKTRLDGQRSRLAQAFPDYQRQPPHHPEPAVDKRRRTGAGAGQDWLRRERTTVPPKRSRQPTTRYTNAIYVTPAKPLNTPSSIYVTHMPPLWVGVGRQPSGSNTTTLNTNTTLSRDSSVTTNQGLLSGNVSHAIWNDLVGEGISGPTVPPAGDRLQPLVQQLSELGSRYVLGRPEVASGALEPQLQQLQTRLAQLDAEEAIDVLVRVGSSLLSAELAGRPTVRRDPAAPYSYGTEPLCRCPKSSVTPGVLAALTSLLALLIYVASLATLAVSSGTSGSSGTTSTATATARSLLTPLPGLQSMAAFVVSSLEDSAAVSTRSNVTALTAGGDAGWAGAAAAVAPLRRLLDSLLLLLLRGSGAGRQMGWRLEQRGVPVTVRRRPHSRRPHLRRLQWPDLFRALNSGLVTPAAAAQAPDYGPTPVDSSERQIPGEAGTAAPTAGAGAAAGAHRSDDTAGGLPIARNVTAFERRSDSRPWYSMSTLPTADARSMERLTSPRPSASGAQFGLVTAPVRVGQRAGRRRQPASRLRRPRLWRLFSWLRAPAGGRSVGRLHWPAAVRRGQYLVSISRQMAPRSSTWRRHRRPPAPRRRRPPHHRRQQASKRRPRKQMAIRAVGSVDVAQNSTASATGFTTDTIPARSADGQASTAIQKQDGHMKGARPHNSHKTQHKPSMSSKPRPSSKLSLKLNLSLSNLKAKLASKLKPKSKTKSKSKPKSKPKPKPAKPYGQRIMCDCKSNLADLLGFLPLAVLIGYSTSVSTAAASSAATGGAAGSVTVTINDADTTTIANTNSPTLTNTDNDVITTAANANPVNTNTNTLTNNDNDVITNTNSATNNARGIGGYPTGGMINTLLRLLFLRDIGSEQCFRRRLCDVVASSRSTRNLLNVASVPVCLLLSSHRGGDFMQYQRAFSAGMGGSCQHIICRS